jgi:hypothetical protein
VRAVEKNVINSKILAKILEHQAPLNPMVVLCIKNGKEPSLQI